MSFDRLAQFFKERWPHLNTTHDVARQRIEDRIKTIECDFGLPVKSCVLMLIAYFLFFSNWLSSIENTRDVALACVRMFFIPYAIMNIGGGIMIAGMRQLPLWFNQLVVMVMTILDVLLLSALTLLTGGFQSLLFWLYLLLIIRNALSIHVTTTQITVNLLTIICFLAAGLTDIAIARMEQETIQTDTDSFILRLVILGTMSLWCYGFQTLFDKQRKVEDEAHEFQIRQEQLQATGRLAAEIAHQLKNPLGIINNAAFTLQRTVKEGKTITQQIHLIREEVHRSDRIITDLMGFAQLAEGSIEPLNISEQLDEAITQVFPDAVAFDVEIQRDYAFALPKVFMQKGHFNEIVVNILQNAREAINGKGKINVSTFPAEGYSIALTLEDNGPGMSQDLLDQVFEPYFTTKEKGTGLGLAIVKHNVEIYGGHLKVESQLGEGTRFILQFPARTLMKLQQ
ncbi:MAG: ATP-binding protein [Verrucomicrobiota bacterium]|nr:ATP-binding protein [Verrucomicrobiota bacterium]